MNTYICVFTMNTYITHVFECSIIYNCDAYNNIVHNVYIHIIFAKHITEWYMVATVVEVIRFLSVCSAGQAMLEVFMYVTM